ncbi:MAG TPA: NYN domain-containing protein [Balneolales bacterium]|nr:NYN domain-containing protein [Balneolales bacterium]
MMDYQKVGIYVDAFDVTINGGFGLRYDILRKFACRDGGYPIRLNVYLAYDKKRSAEDEGYRTKTERFCEVLRDFEYKVIEIPVKHEKDEETGTSVPAVPINVDMAVDIMNQANDLDRLLLLSSDPSFVRLVQAVQNKGARVELVGFDNMSEKLKKEVDMYISGYLIPGLLPVDSPYDWGAVGSRVRGVCYDYSHSDGYGFMRYLSRLDDKLWITDSRFKDSPYKTVFAHISQFEPNFDTSFLPSRDLIFEFDLVENEKGLIAKDIVLISAP